MAANNKPKRTSKLQKPKSPYDPNYFTLPHPAFGALTVILMVYLSVTTLSPESLPEFIWPFAQFGKYMGTQQFNVCIGFCVFTLIAHSMEAAYTGKVCHAQTEMPRMLPWFLVWVFSILLGYQLPLLIGYYRDRRYTASNTFKWALSTFFFGYPSLIRLLSHKPRSKTT